MAPWRTLTAVFVAVFAAALLVFRTRNEKEFCRLSSPRPDQLHECASDTTKDHASMAHGERAWDLLSHLGGYGPYIAKVHGVAEHQPEQDNCHVEQIHMIARHAERYPTVTAGIHMLELYHRIARANITLNGTLAFANHWSFFTGDPAADFEQLTSTGPYAGTLTAFKFGTQLRSMYKDLLLAATADRPLRLWASDSQRVIDTATYFLYGLIGLDWRQKADLQVIPETADQGADTLTPGDTCLRYADDVDEFGWSYGSRMVDSFKSTYLGAVHDRLLLENPAFPLSEDELYIMQELCAFEIMALGVSKWCDVFTHAEWEGFEYARDLLHYYRSGPGNPYAATMGWLWLNATANLLRQGPVAGTMFLSFVHDGDIIPMLTALELFAQRSALPTERIDHNRTWRISDTVPMGARIIFERLTCTAPQECWSNELYPNHVYCSIPAEGLFIRVKINDRTVVLPGCGTGICPLSQFLDKIEQDGKKLDRFMDMCGLQDGVPDAITFLHQQKTSHHRSGSQGGHQA